MIRSRILLGMSLLTLVAAIALAADLQGPRIYVAEPRYDLGLVTEGAVPEHVFEIKNVGDELLIIQRLQPS